MTLLELVEDAFLSALEEGANPPKEFAVRLPWEAFNFGQDADYTEGAEPVLRVAGFTVTVTPDVLTVWNH